MTDHFKWTNHEPPDGAGYRIEINDRCSICEETEGTPEHHESRPYFILQKIIYINIGKKIQGFEYNKRDNSFKVG